ncbi:hypothetical protein AALA24_05370 [Anaerovoracaceae bacterium 42-11]
MRIGMISAFAKESARCTKKLKGLEELSESLVHTEVGQQILNGDKNLANETARRFTKILDINSLQDTNLQVISDFNNILQIIKMSYFVHRD